MEQELSYEKMEKIRKRVFDKDGRMRLRYAVLMYGLGGGQVVHRQRMPVDAQRVWIKLHYKGFKFLYKILR